jgi:hypothetical protein
MIPNVKVPFVSSRGSVVREQLESCASVADVISFLESRHIDWPFGCTIRNLPFELTGIPPKLAEEYAVGALATAEGVGDTIAPT